MNKEKAELQRMRGGLHSDQNSRNNLEGSVPSKMSLDEIIEPEFPGRSLFVIGENSVIRKKIH
jgi:hypothetical protein